MAGLRQQETVRGIEAVLAAHKAAETRREQAKNQDYSEFEFNESDHEDCRRIDQGHVAAMVREATLCKEDLTPIVECNLRKVRGKAPKYFADASNLKPDREEMERMRAFVERARIDNKGMDHETTAAVELMHLMNHKGGSVALFDVIFEWHQSNMKTKKAITSEQLHSFLDNRFGLNETAPFEVEVPLACCKETVSVPCHDAAAQTAALLTDPRISDDDYLFFDDDPHQGPPEEWKELRDINTGMAYRETYKDLIEPDPFTTCGARKILCPYIFYMDATVTGSMQQLSIEILKFTVGLFNMECRRKGYAWRNLGYLPRIITGKTRANQLLRKSGHVDAQKYMMDPDYRRHFAPQYEGVTPNFDTTLYESVDNTDGEATAEAKQPVIASQDLHQLLQVMTHSYKQLQDRGGMFWELAYRGKVHKVLLVPFIIFIKADGQEADKLLGHFVPKMKNIANICRFCTVPTNECHEAYPKEEWPLKTKGMILDLIRKRDKSGLQRLSQHPVWNAFYDLRFGSHNDYGVHQACPLDGLHWILLGMFNYTRDNFFDQTGPKSQLSCNLNDVAISLGPLFQRQSDTDKPRTSFKKGIKEGHIMGHEMEGVMLVLTTTLRSSRGRDYILDEARGKQREYLPNRRFINNWIMLLETKLQFHSWLHSEALEVKLVESLDTKMCEMMNMDKCVAKRDKGMGYNTLNFHGCKHAAEQYLSFGVPGVTDCQSNEQHHKLDKKTARRTNQRPGTWEISVAKKVHQRDLVDIAMEEVRGRPRWYYFQGQDHSDRQEQETWEPFDTHFTGVKTKYSFNLRPGVDKKTLMGSDDPERIVCRVFTSMQLKEKHSYDVVTHGTICEVLEYYGDDIDYLECYTECRVFGEDYQKCRVIYRASPYMEGRPWFDWGIFNLDLDHGPQQDTRLDLDNDWALGHIKCFVDLTMLPVLNADGTPPGLYALVEFAAPNYDPYELGNKSSLFEPYIKIDIGSEEFGGGQHSQARLVSIECLLAPACVIPDLGNENPRAYLRMLPRNTWADMFDDWLREPNTRKFDNPEPTPFIQPRKRRKEKGSGGKKKAKKCPRK